MSERKTEIKRRRHRLKKVKHYAKKIATASVSEKVFIAEKLRGLTPGAEVIIEKWELEKR